MSETTATEAQLRIRWAADVEQPAPIYANFAQAGFTPEDFTLMLGWYAPPMTTSIPPDGVIDVGVQPVARIVVPLNLMRNLVAVLQRQIEGYEQSFGPIPEHPNKPDWLKEPKQE